MAKTRKKPSRLRGGRRPEAPASEDTVEVRKVVANQEALPENFEDRLKHHMATFKGYKDKIAHFSGHLRKARQLCKNEKLDPQIVDLFIKLEKSDPLELKRYLAQLGGGLKATGQSFQLALFDTALGSTLDQATAEGRNAGEKGVAPDNRWPEGTKEADAYMEAYNAAQADIIHKGSAQAVH